MKVLICVLGIALCALGISAFPRPKQDVPPQCIDPTFACQDLQSARLCGVTKDCIHDVWATMSVPDDNDEVCDICKEMVKEARDQLLSNMTQEEIKEVFEGSCKLLPIKLVADGCIKIVDEIIPELVEMLASRMDPTMVCTVSGMCFASHSLRENDLAKMLRQILNQKQVDQCTECTTMMTDVQTFLKTSSEADVKKYIENFCDEKVPSYLCDILVDSYLPTLYTYIVKTDAKALCSSAGVCPKVCKLQDTQQVNDELTCEFCEHVLQHVKDLVTANTTAEEFRTALLNFCKHMGSFSNKCTTLVDDYYDMLFDYIRKLDTKGMCTLIGLCNNNEKCSEIPLIKLIPAVEAQKRVSMIKLQPAIQVSSDANRIPLVKVIPAEEASKTKLTETNDIFPSQLSLEKFIHPLTIFQQDTECAFCKAVSFYLEKDLNGDISKEGIQTALDNVCDKWVKDFPQHCKDFVEKYSEKVKHAIVKGVKLEDVCAFSKACVADNKSELHVRVLSKAEEGPFCDLCKDAMNEVESTLSDPATKEKIENLIDQGCNVLPKSLTDDCISFVKSNVDALIDILQQELQPDNICPALRLCDEKSRLQLPARVKDLECDLCKDVVSSLRKKMSDPAEKQTVLSFLEEGCSKLPGSLSEECKKFVDENIDTVIGMIIEQLDPDSVCGILKICPASLIKKEKIKFKDIECDLCKEVVGKVENMVKDKKTEDEIKSALDKVCSYLPSSLSQKCMNFVNQYTDMLITLLMEEMDPDMVCAALNICPANVQYPAWQSKAQDLECQGCQYALHYLQEQLTSTDTQEEIKNVLKKMCDVLPQTYAKNCDAFVDEYGSSLLVLISQEIDPSITCYELKMCSNQTKLFDSHSILHPFKTDECSICTTVVDYVDKLLEEDDVDKEITSLVEKVCTVLPASYIQKCSTMLETYGPYILQMIGQVADSKQVCQEIDLCSRPDGHVHLLGGNKCTFGPTYWCKSNAHASACKAEIYCKERVWKN